MADTLSSDTTCERKLMMTGIPSSNTTCERKVMAVGILIEHDTWTSGGDAGTSSSNARREREAVTARTYLHRLPVHKQACQPRLLSCMHLLTLLLPKRKLAFTTLSPLLHAPGGSTFGQILNLRWRSWRGERLPICLHRWTGHFACQ